MPKLSDLQSLLLYHASRQPGGSLHPLPDTIKDGRRTTRRIAALVRGGLIEEREAEQREDICRTDGELTFGLYLTASGAAAVGVELDTMESRPARAHPAAEAITTSDRGTSKIANVLKLLCRDDGASIADMIEATGWLPHTTRAALTGLRKKGHQIEKMRSDDVTRYRIMAAAA